MTVADLSSQALISLALADAFPNDAIVGEEDGALLRTDGAGTIAIEVLGHVERARPGISFGRVVDALDRCGHPGGPTGRFWTLDPVDGTKGFLRGGQYAVALALVEDGEVVLGVLGCPKLDGSLFVAERGHGAWTEALEGNGRSQPLAVHPPAMVSEARLAESVESGHSALDDGARVAALLGLRSASLRIDSQAKYATVARGETQIYLRLPTDPTYRERIWDHAAGWLLVTEAGGTVTDIRGRAFDFGSGRRLERNDGVVATSGGALHEAVLGAVTQVLEG